MIELRPMAEAPEFRSAENGTRLVAEGVAMRYGSPSGVITTPAKGAFRERFEAGAFTRSINGGTDIRSHLEHGGPFLGRTGSGSLRTIDTPTELRYELDLPDTSAGRDAAVLLERRDVAGSSIGFRAIPKRTTWSLADDGMALRTVAEAQLSLIDLTVAPAYPTSTAEAALRSLADDLGVEVRSLLEAPDLGALLAPGDPAEDDSETDDGDGAQETPTAVRAPIASLFL